MAESGPPNCRGARFRLGSLARLPAGSPRHHVPGGFRHHREVAAAFGGATSPATAPTRGRPGEINCVSFCPAAVRPIVGPRLHAMSEENPPTPNIFVVDHP